MLYTEREPPMRRVVLSTLCASIVAACGGQDPTPPVDQRALLCAREARSDPFMPGLEKATEGGGWRVRLVESLVREHAGPPDRGLNTWRVEVRDAAGAVRTDLPVRLKAWMPDHGHGTTPLYHSGEVEGQQVRLGPFDLFMGGFWQLTVLVEDAGVEDPAVFGFCVEG